MVQNTSGPADGSTFDPNRDQPAIDIQRLRTWDVIRDNQWHTSVELEERVGSNWASVGARVRDFRKARFGRRTVLNRRVAGQRGLWEYRLVPENGQSDNGRPILTVVPDPLPPNPRNWTAAPD